MKAYAGIGSRRTPEDILELMEKLAAKFGKDGLVLRSGGAPGADQAFDNGAKSVSGKVELYIPWKGFQDIQDATLTSPDARAFEISSQFHPAWRYLKRGAKLLHARNAHQILGKELNDPVQFVVCWTPDGSLDGAGKDTGGTGQAMRIAHHYKIPIFNLKNPEHFTRLSSSLEK